MMNLVQKALGCWHKVPGKYFGHDSASSPHSSHSGRGSGDGASGSENFRNNFGPMPPLKELEKEFEIFVAELDLTPEKQEAMYEISPEKKWLMLCEQSYREERQNCFQAPEHFIAVLHQVANDPTKSNSAVLNHFESLRITLNTQSHSYVRRYLQLGGLNLMTDILRKSAKERFYGSDQLATAVLACFKALLNSTHGRQSVLSSNKALLSIAVATCIESSKGKVSALQILSGLCLVPPEGHRKVLQAVTNASKLLGERRRFQKLLSDLWRNFRDAKQGISVKTAIMSFINALFKAGNAETSLEFRLHLRFEFLMIGIEPIIEDMRSVDSPILQDHLDLFEMMRQEDEQEFACQYEIDKTIDFKQPESICDALVRKINHSNAYPHFVSLLGHLLLLPGDAKNVELWRFFDMVAQQVSLQANIGEASDAVEPLPKLNMERLLNRLHTEKDFESLTEELKQERSRCKSLEEKLRETQQLLLSKNTEETRTAEKTADSFSLPLTPPESPPTVSPAPQASPVPSGTPPPPAPPPPPVAYLKSPKNFFLKQDTGPKKDVPKASVSLKTVNWQKLPATQLEGTIWTELKDEELYKVLDLSEIDCLFAAAGSKDKNDSGNEAEGYDSFDYGNTMKRRKTRESTVTLIEGRRAQNCTILLSKLKLSNEEMKHAMLTMDEDGLIPKDMVEQLLKFVPTKEEMGIIEETVGATGPEILAVADRFLWEMNQIPRYEERLRCLHYRKVFRDRLEDLKPQIEAVTKASGCVLTSSRLRQLLAIVLAFGNYMNRGKRNSDATGFSLPALNSLIGVKSAQKLDYSLLHLVVETVEKQFPDLLRIKKDLSPVYDASRVNGAELDSELKGLDSGLSMIEQEIANADKTSLVLNLAINSKTAGICLDTSGDTETDSVQEASLFDPEEKEEDSSRKSSMEDESEFGSGLSGDLFVPVMSEFHKFARSALQELNLSVDQMKTAFISCVKGFGADPSVSPDEFFGIFSKFLSSFSDIHRSLWKQKEEQERRQKATVTLNTRKNFFTTTFGVGNFRKKKDYNKKTGNRDSGDFDQLISALQSGELFSEELTRLRTSFRKPNRRISAEGTRDRNSTDDKTESSGTKVEFRKKKAARPLANSAPPYLNGRVSNFNFEMSRER